MIESFAGALFLAGVLLFGWRLTPSPGHGGRRVASASAGVAVAYVFIYMLPELGEAGSAFLEATRGLALPAPEYRVYSAALAGFVLMYGVEHLRQWSRKADAEGELRERRTFRLHAGGFACYTAMVSLTMGESGSRRELPVALYCFAMGLHFVGISGDLYAEHGPLYLKPGRFILAVAVLAGWAAGAFVPLPRGTLYTLLGLVSGGVVLNSMVMELPREKDGRFWPFVLGACAYAIVLILLARMRVPGA
jgi:hypothetical protein